MKHAQSQQNCLQQCRLYYPFRDAQLWIILLASLLTGFALCYLLPKNFAADIVSSPLLLINVLLLYPVVEELLFRGFIQSALLSRATLAIKVLGISRANLVTSILFVALHFVNHPPAWALAVFLPSLTLGHIRERYRSLVAPMLLHIFFNAIYLFAGA